MSTNAEAPVMGNEILDKRNWSELIEDFDWRDGYGLD